MQQQIKLLAEQAGFILWTDEDWKPHNEVIDWSSRYDDELKKLVYLVVQECIDIVPWQYEEKIKKHFGVEE